MNLIRWLGVGLGVGAVLAALAVSVEPALAAGVDPTRTLVAFFGLVALLLGLRAVYARFKGELRQAEPGDPGERDPVPVPGTEFDDMVSGVAALGRSGVLGARQHIRQRRQIHQRLESAAVGLLRREEGLSEAESRDRLAAGSWTDDPVAAAVFADGSSGMSLFERARLTLTRESGFQARVRHAVADLVGRLGVTPDPPPADDAGERDEESESASTSEPAPGGNPEPIRRTDRWRGLGAVAVLALAAGVLAGRPPLVLGAVVGVGFAAYARAGTAPSPTLSIARRVADAEPDPDDEVRVWVTVENTGPGTLPDVRVVDGVPAALTVAEGTATHATALRPGESATFSYVVRVIRGEHEFEPATVLLRDWSGSVEREASVGDATTVTCAPRLSSGEGIPLRTQTSGYVGHVTTDTGGDGTEFHAVREYRHGDPTSRIDWKRAARTGELATLQFRQERAATVVLLIDAREEAYVAPAPGDRPAVERCVAAAGEVFAALLEAGDQVGIAALSPLTCWLPPGSGDGHRAQARDLLATAPAFSATSPDRAFYPSIKLRWLRRRLPEHAQVILLSPLVDDYVASVARRLNAYGYPVTAISPDPTTAGTAGQSLALLERSLRISELRRADIAVLDWERDRRLAAVLADAGGRWSA